MDLTHPFVQSTLLPAAVSSLAWVLLKATRSPPSFMPLAIGVGGLSVYCVVFGLPLPTPRTALDKLIWFVVVGLVVGAWTGLREHSHRKLCWGICAWLLASHWLLGSPSQTTVVPGAALFAVLSCIYVSALSGGDDRIRLNTFATTLAALGLAGVLLSAGSASLFQLLIGWTVAIAVVAIAERARVNSTRIGLTLATGAPVLLIGSYAWRYTEVDVRALGLLALIFTLPWAVSKTLRHHPTRYIVVLITGLALIAGALGVSSLLQPVDDAYY